MSPNPLTTDLDQILTHAEGLWEEFRGQRLFITGGTGFFGCWLLESFLWANAHRRLKAQVIVLTRDPAAFRRKVPHLADDPAVVLQAGDVRSFEFPPGRFSHIIHAAASPSVTLNQEQPLVMVETIVDGTRRTLEFARQGGARQVLLISSGAVYGPPPPELTQIPEEFLSAPDPTVPRSAYAEGKRLAELLGALYATTYGLEVKIARCFAFVGPYQPLDSQFAVGNFIRDGLNGGPIRVRGDGTPYRSYLYAADLAIWLWHIFLRGQSCRPYNVGSEEALSIADVAEAVAAAFDPRPAIRIAKTPPGHQPERYVPSTQRARSELSLRPTIGLRDAVARTIAWHQQRLASEGQPMGHQANVISRPVTQPV